MKNDEIVFCELINRYFNADTSNICDYSFSTEIFMDNNFKFSIKDLNIWGGKMSGVRI